jgi:type VI secretion system FHA domain protein
MAVTIKIFTKHGGRPSLFQTREFESLPVTLGRDAACTVSLDDPHKHISRVHVELEQEGNQYWLSVVSKVNPVTVKGQRHGPGSRLVLHSGDSFEMGEFEVQLVFTEKTRPPIPTPSEKRSMIESLAGDDERTPVLRREDVPPPEPGLFDEPTALPTPASAGTAGPEEPTYIGPAMPKPAPKPAPIAAKPAAPAPKPAPVVSGPSMKDAVRVFLDGASMPYKDLSAQESERLLRECGAILRASVEGLMTLLIARSELRKEFEAAERTMVAARDNNPLKLMGDPQEAMDFLFDPSLRNEGFLEPLQAITDAAQDLRAHELALMAGMRAAMIGALRRFDPQVLEKNFGKAAGGFSLGGRKGKLWDLFVEHQQKLAHEAQEDFNKVFGRDFMTAYESQLRRLKSGQ